MRKLCYDKTFKVHSIIYEENGTFYGFINKKGDDDPQLVLVITDNRREVNFTNCVIPRSRTSTRYQWNRSVTWRDVIERPLALIMEALL